MSLIKSLVRRTTSEATRKAMRRRFERTVLARMYAGDRYNCPVCKWSFQKLLPGGYNGRPNARCPRCGSYERHRTLHLLLERLELDTVGPYSILHIAPEPSITQTLRALLPIEGYVTLDLYMPNVDHRCSVTDIPLADNAFDLAICSHVLAVVPDHLAAIAELCRVLKYGGTLLLQDPYRFDRETIDRENLSQGEIRQFFGRAPVLKLLGTDFFEHLVAIGFDVEIYDPVERLPEDIRDRFQLKETVIICRKKEPSGEDAGLDGRGS